MGLTDDKMWKAVVDCDKSYDGQFFYAVKTVGVYCRPSCKSRTPLRKNTNYFETQEDAEKAGFRPCKRCRPDLLDYAPMLELAQQTKNLIDDYFQERNRLAAEMKRLGVSASHLAAVFKQQYGMVPSQYLNKTRLDYTRKMLAETDTPIIDIAGNIGYDSLPSFYGFFKKQTGTTPREYRELNKVPGIHRNIPNNSKEQKHEKRIFL
ncbi:bifunctional transcriptional activator/DNA repair enzyme AdaA [Desulfosporosinus youngiae]|uniref:Adenosine deaminase n=1 Tax=Desulfosporosinus youngiae DSM 17734 TaxID=768710 RepID=H5Y4R0_9FIRM|nr:Ada metal-binding domain-containing protein [Desulfosporosinus youngiae]EHQ89796.1 adenosine deaminase [Desulfosporosinus youngiae DSM 17734]